MKSALLSAIALGVLVLGAAGSQAYGPSPAPILATEPAFTKVHAIGTQYHLDCRFGPPGGFQKKPKWHKHIDTHYTNSRRCGTKTNDDGPRVGPSSCAATPTTRCLGRWSCQGRDSFQKCCTRWVCAPVIKNPQTKEPFDIRPKPLPGSRRVPPSSVMR
jgi:hypothetical protein